MDRHDLDPVVVPSAARLVADHQLPRMRVRRSPIGRGAARADIPTTGPIVTSKGIADGPRCMHP